MLYVWNAQTCVYVVWFTHRQRLYSLLINVNCMPCVNGGGGGSDVGGGGVVWRWYCGGGGSGGNDGGIDGSVRKGGRMSRSQSDCSPPIELVTRLGNKGDSTHLPCDYVLSCSATNSCGVVAVVIDASQQPSKGRCIDRRPVAPICTRL